MFTHLAVDAFGIKSFEVFQPNCVGCGDCIVFDDLSFIVQNAVPEPATWAMMIAGFGMAGAAARSRRRQRLA